MPPCLIAAAASHGFALEVYLVNAKHESILFSPNRHALRNWDLQLHIMTQRGKGASNVSYGI